MRGLLLQLCSIRLNLTVPTQEHPDRTLQKRRESRSWPRSTACMAVREAHPQTLPQAALWGLRPLPIRQLGVVFQVLLAAATAAECPVLCRALLPPVCLAGRRRRAALLVLEALAAQAPQA